MDSSEIPEFIEHELCGEDWSHEHLDAALDALYSNGGGTFDPVSIVQGPTEFGTDEAVYGMADKATEAPRPYSKVFPLVSNVP